MSRPSVIEALRTQLRERSGASPGREVASVRFLGQDLRAGAVHEWFSVDHAGRDGGGRRGEDGDWSGSEQESGSRAGARARGEESGVDGPLRAAESGLRAGELGAGSKLLSARAESGGASPGASPDASPNAAGNPRAIAGGGARPGTALGTKPVNRRRGWSPPLCLLTDLACRAVEARAGRSVFWIGRACWPYPVFFDAHPELFRASVYIDAPTPAGRVWAMDVALRCATPVVVIADGQGLRLPETRRLQAAAGSSGSVCLLARPGHELAELSAATTRWAVSPAPGEPAKAPATVRARWTVTLVRHKDRPTLTDERPSWTVEWDDASGCLHLPPALAGRAGRAAIPGRNAHAGFAGCLAAEAGRSGEHRGERETERQGERQAGRGREESHELRVSEHRRASA